MNTQHEMLGVANNTGIPVQGGHQVPTHNPNMQAVDTRWQGFWTTGQAWYNQIHGTVHEPVIQQQPIQQQPQRAQAPQQPQSQQPQQIPVANQQPQVPVAQQHAVPNGQPPVVNPDTVPAPDAADVTNGEDPVVITEEEKQKIEDEGEEKKAELKKEQEEAANPDQWKEVLLEKLIDEWNQYQVETLKAQKKSEYLEKRNNQLEEELNEIKYNGSKIAVAEQWRWLATLANKYYENTEDSNAKERYLWKILNTVGELTGLNAYEMFNNYSQGWKRVVANMSGASWASAQNPNMVSKQQYKPQGVVRKSGGRKRRF